MTSATDTKKSVVEKVIMARERDLGGFSVRRILPYATHRMVGPFIFFDHMGPVDFAPGTGMDVRPHPHVHLATVTYLFDGQIHHRDSLGSDQLIEPGAINWMTAGRGIVHSERSPADFRASGGRVNGLQCWVALPEGHEDIAPSFCHHPAATLPGFQVGKAEGKLLLGRAFGYESPVEVHSDLFYVDMKLPSGEGLDFPAEGRDTAVYMLEGKVTIEGQELAEGAMGIIRSRMDFTLEAIRDARFMLLGGAPMGERFIYWNFVASSQGKLEQAKKDWARGPGDKGTRFPRVPGDEEEFIPLA